MRLNTFGCWRARLSMRRQLVMLHDLLMAGLAWYLAKWLRLTLSPHHLAMSFQPLEFPIVLVLQGLVFNWLGLYRGVWRFASLHDLWNILRAALAGTLGIGLALFIYMRLDDTPRLALLIYPLVLSLLLGLPRLCYRLWKDQRPRSLRTVAAKRVLVIGADSVGEALVRDLRRDRSYVIAGFVDDQPRLRGARINGIPVLGNYADLPELARKTRADMLLIALSQASSAQMRAVVEQCERSGLPYRTVPRIEDIVNGRASLNELKEVAIEDLLGRDSVELDWTLIGQRLTGQRVLVTGGGGSIGAELCRQIARLGVYSLTVVEQNEFNLYQITRELRQQYPELLFDDVLADAGDEVAMRHAYAQSRPQLVFHAAAYKHVPILQDQLRAGFRNNVLTTRLMSELASEFGVEYFVLISTDKAVNPTSVMGACKRIAEIWCQNLDQHSSTHFITVRFGNVLDSAGSVVPLFREQIQCGGPLTVTHPEITRYFMTIPEACQLILQAASQGKGGEIFALDMGEPVRIQNLAEQMIRLAGKTPGSDIQIVYTGLRPGEKMFEELFHTQEQYRATGHAKIFLAQHRPVAWELLQVQLGRAGQAVAAYDEAALRQSISTLLPSFMWSEHSRPAAVIALRS